MTVSITKPTVGAVGGWGVLLNAALDAIVTEVNLREITPTLIKTANYTSAAGEFVKFDLTSGNLTWTLPNAPADGTRAGAKILVQPGTNTLTIQTQGSDFLNISPTTSGTFSLLKQAVQFQYEAATHIWDAVSGDLPLSQLDLRYEPITAQSATAVAIASSGTIAASGSQFVSRVAPTGNVTGVILTAGTVAGQGVTVLNESAFTVTFAASGTSHVADGVSDVVAALTSREFVWDTGTSLWYRQG